MVNSNHIAQQPCDSRQRRWGACWVGYATVRFFRRETFLFSIGTFEIEADPSSCVWLGGGSGGVAPLITPRTHIFLISTPEIFELWKLSVRPQICGVSGESGDEHRRNQVYPTRVEGVP